MIRIALVDDHRLFRSGIRALLSANENFEVVFEASNGQEFIEKLAEHPVEVVLLDIEMPDYDGMWVLQQLREHKLKVHAIMVSMHNDEGYIAHTMEAGARGYLLKNANPDEIEQAICSVHQTGYFFSPLVSASMLKKLAGEHAVKPSYGAATELSTREIEVLRLICQEHTAAEIAEKLFISVRTVEGHRARISEKIGAKNTAGLVVFAVKNKLI
jgi:DNA-binding NarL/FixJ family response regulator